MKQLKLSQKGIILAAFPITCQILLLAYLCVLLVPFEVQVRKQAKDYAVSLALSCLHNDIALLQGILNASLPSKSYLAPDWIVNWAKEHSSQAASLADRNRQEAWALAQEEPQQAMLMPGESYSYWSGQAKLHIEDLRALVSADPARKEMVTIYETLFHQYFQNISQARSYCQRSQPLEAVRPTAQARIILKNLENLTLKLGGEDSAEQTKALASGQQPDARNLNDLAMTFGYLTGSGLALNLAGSIILVLLFGRTSQRRLSAVMDNMSRLTNGQMLGTPLTGDDELAQIDGSFHQMAADLEASRKRERAIVENASDVICALDAQNVFQQVNQAAARLWGIPSQELIGKPVRVLVSPDDADATVSALDKLRQLNLSLPIENRVIKPDGTTVFMLWSCRWSTRDSLMLCVARDITEQKKLARLKQDFITMVSNELRTPLVYHDQFLAKASAGQMGELTPEGLERSSKARTATKRLVSLVNDLLDLERLASGKLDLKPAPINSSELITRTFDSLALVAEGKGIELKKDGDDLEFVADADRLVQVLVNLVGNSLKFSPKGSAITIAAHRHNDCVEFRVRDKGRGIPEALRQSIFERFKQVKRTDATEKGGTGLGLAICKKIIEAHGGEIGVDSVEGQGSTFWFRLPG